MPDTIHSQSVSRPDQQYPDLDRIPHQLRERKRWLLWRRGPARRSDRKPSKEPLDCMSGRPINHTSHRHWYSFDDALDGLLRHGADGIGLALAADGLIGIDLDSCRDPQSGSLDPWAEEIVASLRTYTEASPSARGVRLFALGELPEGRRRNGLVEVYDRLRFLTVTGQRLDGSPPTVEERPAEVLALYERYLRRPDPPSALPLTAAPVALLDCDLISLATAAPNGAKFARLWGGDWSGYHSQSEADLSLCRLLAFWTGRDAPRIASLFLASGLGARAKARRQDYLCRTVQRAISLLTCQYTPSPSRQTPPHCVCECAASATGEVRNTRSPNSRTVSVATLRRQVQSALPDQPSAAQAEQHALRLDRLRLLARLFWDVSRGQAIPLSCRLVASVIGLGDRSGKSASRLIRELLQAGDLVRVQVENRQQRHRERLADEYTLAGELLRACEMSNY